MKRDSPLMWLWYFESDQYQRGINLMEGWRGAGAIFACGFRKGGWGGRRSGRDHGAKNWTAWIFQNLINRGGPTLEVRPTLHRGWPTLGGAPGPKNNSSSHQQKLLLALNYANRMFIYFLAISDRFPGGAINLTNKILLINIIIYDFEQL